MNERNSPVLFCTEDFQHLTISSYHPSDNRGVLSDTLEILLLKNVAWLVLKNLLYEALELLACFLLIIVFFLTETGHSSVDRSESNGQI